MWGRNQWYYYQYAWSFLIDTPEEKRKTVSMGIGILRASSSFILSPLFIESIYSRLKHRHPPSIKSPFYPAHLDYIPTKFVTGQQKLMTGHFSRTIGVNEIKLSSLRSHFHPAIHSNWTGLEMSFVIAVHSIIFDLCVVWEWCLQLFYAFQSQCQWLTGFISSSSPRDH